MTHSCELFTHSDWTGPRALSSGRQRGEGSGVVLTLSDTS